MKLYRVVYYAVSFTICTILLSCDLCHSSLFYPASSAFGIFAAVAVPLDLPPRNVFVSYNFEANYNLPDNWDTPSVYKGAESSENFETSRKTFFTSMKAVRNISYFAGDERVLLASTEQQQIPAKRRRALLTRTNIYNILIDTFRRSGFRGESCLLRLICEMRTTSLTDINGVLGSLINVIFSPTTSQAEKMPQRFYQAELDGLHNQCHNYWKNCSESLLDLISRPFEEILKLIEDEKFEGVPKSSRPKK